MKHLEKLKFQAFLEKKLLVVRKKVLRLKSFEMSRGFQKYSFGIVETPRIRLTIFKKK